MLTHVLLLLELPAQRNKLLVNGQVAQTPIFQDFVHLSKFLPHIQFSGFHFRAQMEWNEKIMKYNLCDMYFPGQPGRSYDPVLSSRIWIRKGLWGVFIGT